ncbi:11112_t:CDS:10, partial [Funneliformis geosporum]
MADQYIEVSSGYSNNNYANVSLIVDIAERTSVHAVWAGWTCIREPESLAQSKHKIVFIGPPNSAMHSLGDKISSTIVAQSANVPTMDWSYSKYHWIYQASEGGEGKGIRKVENPDNFKQEFAQVQGEVPGSPIFIMRLARDARHHEVQFYWINTGNAISLFGRDFSVQRRHQKIIEEAPLRLQNKRHLNRWKGLLLQVEHPTTEMVTGVNLPAVQLQIAMLHQIRDIRILYGLAQRSCSITAENPDAGFKPSSGMVHELNFAAALMFGIFLDFRTAVEYLVKLLETQAFEENSFTTGLLDMLIYDENLTAEKPDKMLAVICGAVTKAYTAAMESIMEYKVSWRKDKSLAEIYCAPSAPDSFTLYLNGSRVQVFLTDGGVISKTCLLEQENDPTQLLLLSWKACEILWSLTIIRVRHVLPFALPAMNPPVLVCDKAHQRFCEVKHIFGCILDGYDIQAMLQSSVKEIIELLEYSDLPYLESHAVLSALSGRIPAKLETALLRISNETHILILFSNSDKREEAVHALRDEYKNDLRLGPQMLDKLLFTVFEKLAELGGRFTTKVTLKARELLIHCHLTSYEERYAQMEQIMKAAVIESHYGDYGYDYRTPSYDSLKELIDTRFVVFDVLPNFFYHQDNQAPFMVSWNFSLHSATTDSPTGSVESPSSFSMRRSASISDLSYLIPKIENEPLRVGAMISCTLNEEIEKNIPRILKLFPKIQTEAVKGFIDRHGKRLWRLRATAAEVRFKVVDLTLGTSYLYVSSLIMSP